MDNGGAVAMAQLGPQCSDNSKVVQWEEYSSLFPLVLCAVSNSGVQEIKALYLHVTLGFNSRNNNLDKKLFSRKTNGVWFGVCIWNEKNEVVLKN